MLDVQIKKRFGAGAAAAGFALDVAFTAPPGVTILFGASGAGKSTTLQAIAGITRPDDGRIAVGDNVFFDGEGGINLAIRARRVGYVFQSLALFPHLTAQQNIEFGMREGDAGRRRARARQLAEAFQIEHTLSRPPRQISGGEAQRVALARALASAPQVLLLDEPLSALDEATKAGIIADLKAINADLQLPVLYVTHSRDEAVTIGERVIVCQGGRVVATGEPLEVFGAPLTASLARLTGVENLFDGVVIARNEDGGTMSIEVNDATGSCRIEAPLARRQVGERARLAIAAGDILLATAKLHATSARNLLGGRIEAIEAQSRRTLVRVVAGVRWQVGVTPQAVSELGLTVGKPVWLAFKTHSCHLLDE